jgi:hypothetical protein
MTAPEPAPPPARRPAALGNHGRRLWKAVTVDYRLRPDELILLETACRTVKLVEELRLGMVGQPLTTMSSADQLREHPLLSEARAQRALLRSLLTSLKLPDVGSGTGTGQVNQHRAAAQSRWAAAHGTTP